MFNVNPNIQLPPVKNAYVQMACDLIEANMARLNPTTAMFVGAVKFGIMKEYGELDDTPEMDKQVLEGLGKKLGICHELAKGFEVMDGPIDEKKIKIYSDIKAVVEKTMAENEPTNVIDI